MKSSFTDMNIRPSTGMEIFDTIIKPIALYECEVWGAFGNKSLVDDALYANDKASYEKLHLKCCKQIFVNLKTCIQFLELN